MNFIHEFDAHGWKTYHRLVWINPEGKRVESPWALYEHPAFLSSKAISGIPETDLTPETGYVALTDYYTSNGSMVALYSTSPKRIQVTAYDLTKEEHKAAQVADEEADDVEFAMKA